MNLRHLPKTGAQNLTTFSMLMPLDNIRSELLPPCDDEMNAAVAGYVIADVDRWDYPFDGSAVGVVVHYVRVGGCCITCKLFAACSDHDVNKCVKHICDVLVHHWVGGVQSVH